MRLDFARPRPRHSGRRQDQRLLQARRRPARTPGAPSPRFVDRHRFPHAGRLPGSCARRRADPRRHQGVAHRQYRRLRGWRSAREAPHRSRAGVAAVGPILCVVRGGPRPCAGAAAVQRSRPLLEPATPRRAARVSNPLRPLGVRDRPARRPARRRRHHGAALHAAGGEVRPFEFHGSPGLIYLDPRWHQAVLRFVVEGFWHILDGTDHLPFLACLVIPFRRLRPLVIIVTSFTVAHSITLLASAFGFAPDWLWFPPLIETLIAVTIVFMALENIVGSNIGLRWIYAFAFGLIHGFGFSFALREQLQFAGDHLVTSLLGFNFGVEIGQLAVLFVLVPALNLLFRYLVAERIGVIILSALVAHTGWHWMLDRGAVLAKFPFPTLDAAFFASLMRGAMAVLILAALVWLASGFVRRFMQGKDTKDAFADKALAKAPA